MLLTLLGQGLPKVRAFNCELRHCLACVRVACVCVRAVCGVFAACVRACVRPCVHRRLGAFVRSCVLVCVRVCFGMRACVRVCVRACVTASTVPHAVQLKALQAHSSYNALHLLSFHDHYMHVIPVAFYILLQ